MMRSKTGRGERVIRDARTASGGESAGRRVRFAALGAAVLCALLGVLLLSAATALADRTFVAKIPEFTTASSVVFDANDNAWITDYGHTTPTPNSGQNGLYKYDPFPSQTLLDTPDTHIPWGYSSLELQAAVDNENGEIFVAMANGRTLDIFDENGVFSEEWSSINGSGGVVQAGFHVAIDNSNTYSRGRVYLSLTATEDYIEVVDAAKHPVDFPATASYISGNRLTGTPSGPFGEVQFVSVDANGNLYVTDVGNSVVDEFDSSGTFLRSFPAPGASGGNPGTGGVAIDPTNGNVLITGNGVVNEYDSSGNHLETLNVEGAEGTPAVNSNGYLYVPRQDRIDIFSPNVIVPNVTYKPVSNPTTTSGTLNATIDPNNGGNVTTCQFEYGTSTEYSLGTVRCSPDPNASPPSSNFSSQTDVNAAISGLSTETTYHYRVVVTNAKGTKYGSDQTYTPHSVVGLRTDAATNVTAEGATLNGTLVGDGSPTSYYFEWGPTNAYGHTSAPPPGADIGSPSGPNSTPLSYELSGLAPYSTYHYRVVASNGAGTSNGEDRMFTTTPGPPSASGAAATEVHSDRALLHGEVNPNGAVTGVHFEYVDDATYQQSGWASATSTSPDIGVGMSKDYASASLLVNGLDPGTLYHYRVVGTNDMGSGSAEATFRTFAFIPSFNDPCPNAHVRQQTGASLLLDCRAYELVSAADAGGHNVESNLVPGQTPFGGYPNATNPPQVLYGVHNGGIPGTGHPTNRGVDPYVATRTESGWITKYVGIPADGTPSDASFSSTLSEADASLGTFAFGGENLCSPCFADGSTGAPIHLPNGELVQGMTGSIPQPAAEPAGFIARHLSADGTHFVFGSKARFESDGNEGEVSIYDRNLVSEETRVVSKTPSGQTMKEEGTEIGELDISKNGSRIVIGHLVSEAGEAKYWHLYMNVGDSEKTLDLTPGTTSGVLYDGMTEDGSKVFFTTVDKLTGEDKDSSPDIYEAEVSGESVSLHLISKGNNAGNPGEPGNSDSCDPAANTKHEHWNTTGKEENCGVVAIGGGGGAAPKTGTIYFLSPELLDGTEEPKDGVNNAPNLYVVTPGSTPHFVATLESSANAPLPPSEHPLLRSFGAFGNPSGVAIDHATGDIYVLDIGVGIGTGYIYKFDSTGHQIIKSGTEGGFGVEGKLTVSGTWGGENLPTELAVDNDPNSPNYGDLYVPELLNRVVGQFNASGVHLSDFSPGGFQFPTGVAVDPANGSVYVTEGLFGSSVDIFNTSGILERSFPTIESPTSIGVDSSGNAYVVNGGGYFAPPGGITEKYDSSGNDLGRFGGNDGHISFGVAVDPSNDHVYVDEGTRVVELDSSGNEVGAPTGSGMISGSFGVAADSGNLEVSNPSDTNVSSYGPAVVPPDPHTDNPVVVDSVSSGGTRNTADFQVNASGNDAVFTSTLPLTGYDNGGHREVFRYDAPSGSLDCASCNPTGEQATGEATLATNGSSLTDDGRVFFNSTEGLVDRDLNNKMDVYEWAQNASNPSGVVQLISTGTGPLDSSLLSVSADGTDAYFFTRDTLVNSDHNGSRVKIYDARAGGGFDQAPPPHQCQASDECHGAGSQAPPSPVVKSISGSGGNRLPSGKCKKRYVKRRGKCVKTRHRGHRHRRGHRHG